MTYASATYTHGGAGLYKQVLEKMIAEGWSILETIENRIAASIPESVATAIALQTNGPAISVTITALNTFYDLPVAMISNYTVQKNGAGATLIENTDYQIDKARGQIKGLSGGAFAPGDNATIAIGAYTIRQGWIVMSSNGVNTQEDIKIGMRMLATPCSTSGVFSGSAAAPVRTGIQWAIFKVWVTGSGGSQWIQDLGRTVRNEITRDVLMSADPTDAVNQKYYIAVNKDRVLVYSSQTGGEQTWAAIGFMFRIRPKAEQTYPLFLMGNSAALTGSEFNGPVWDTDQIGSVGTQTNFGSVYLYDIGEFAGDTAGGGTNADLGANNLQNEPGATNFPNSSITNYFELHPVVVARGNTLDDDANNRIYGPVDGLAMVVKNPISHETVLTWQGDNWIILGSSAAGTRFLAFRQT